MSHTIATLTTVRAVTFACVMPVVVQSATAEISILPKGMEHRLMEEGSSRVFWYAKNEGSQFLVTGSLLLGGYLLDKALDTMAPQVPAGALLATAGVLLDYSLSPSWKDFALKQAVRLPYSLYRLCNGHNLYAWLSPLLMESPTLLTAAWEINNQIQLVLPEGVRQIHTGLHAPAYDLAFHNSEVPFFSIHVKNQWHPQCVALQSGAGILEWLEHVSCAADKSGIHTVRLTPHSKDDVNTLRVCLDSQERASSKDLCFTIQSLEAENAFWLTEMLSKPVNSNTAGAVLSLFSECVLDATRDFILNAGKENEQTEVYCEDMLLPTVSGTYIQLTTLGEKGYLLADHTDTQGLSLPEMWLVNAPKAPLDTLTVELSGLEERRIPGPEYGVWRLLSSVRSTVHHTLLNRVFDWLTYKRPPCEADNYKGKIDRFVVTEDRMGELEGIDIDSEIKAINNIKGEVVIVTGLLGKSHVMNTLAKKTVVMENTGMTPSGFVIETADLGNGHYLVEMQAPEYIRSCENTLPANLVRLQEAWFRKSRYVLVNQREGTYGAPTKALFSWLLGSLGAVDGHDKLHVVLNPKASDVSQLYYDAGRQRLQGWLKKAYGVDNVPIGGINEPNAPTWISEIKKIAD